MPTPDRNALSPSPEYPVVAEGAGRFSPSVGEIAGIAGLAARSTTENRALAVGGGGGVGLLEELQVPDQFLVERAAEETVPI